MFLKNRLLKNQGSRASLNTLYVSLSAVRINLLGEHGVLVESLKDNLCFAAEFSLGRIADVLILACESSVLSR